MHPTIANALTTMNALVDRAAARFAGFERRTLAWGGLALAAVTFLAFNLLSANLFRSWKADMTREGLYTISEGTRKALRGIDEPIELDVYFSKRLGEISPAHQKSFVRVRTLLEQYRALSANKLRVTYFDPEPFSDAEDKAVSAGLRGIRLNQAGETGYFGLAGRNSTDNEQNIALFTEERERFIEYDVTRLIYTLANPKKRVVGLVSSINLEGGLDPTMGMRGRPQPPQMVLEQIRDVFEIRPLDKGFSEVPKDVDVLMLVQPENLSAASLFAIDQFALSGGKVLAFVDPLAETQQRGAPMMMAPQGPPKFGDFEKLLSAWGVALDTSKVAGDRTHARRVQFGGGRGGGTVTQYVAWLGLDKRNLDQRDVLSAGVEKLNLATAGILTPVAGATTRVTPLLQTSAESMAIATVQVGMMPDAPGLLRSFKSGQQPLMLAARIGGEAKTSFPSGAPAAADKATDAKAATEPAPAPPPAQKSDTPPQSKPADAAKALSSGQINVVVVADTDLLNDQFWVEVREMLGQQVAIPHAHNAAFVVGALENLSGSDALVSLRGRGITDRPFTLVEGIRTDAEQRFRDKEQGLTTRLREVQEQLSKLEKGGSGDSVLLTDKDRQTIEKFRADMLATRRELRDVRRGLQQDIDRLDGWLKFVNIAGVPLLVGVAGLLLAARRRRAKSPL